MIQYDKYKKSLLHLQAQFENYQSLDDSLPQLIQEAVAESVIQRFETCYDCMWKVVKRYMVEELGLAEVPNSPKPIFRIANENQLLPSDISQWLIYADSRVATSHDDSGEKAKAALLLMGGFVSDAIQLYSHLSGEPWNVAE